MRLWLSGPIYVFLKSIDEYINRPCIAKTLRKLRARDLRNLIKLFQYDYLNPILSKIRCAAI